MAEEATAPPRRPIGAAVLMIVGGAAVAIGSLLSFAEVGAGDLPIPGQSITGLDTTDGKIFLGAGIVIALFGLVTAIAKSSGLRRTLSAITLLAAALLLVFAIIDVVTLEDTGLDAIAEEAARQTPGLTAEDARSALAEFNLTISPGIGLWVVIAGAALALLGGIVGLLKGGAPPTAAPPPPLATEGSMGGMPPPPDAGPAAPPPPPAPGSGG